MEYNCLMRGKDEVSNLEADGLKTDIDAMKVKEMTRWESQGEGRRTRRRRRRKMIAVVQIRCHMAKYLLTLRTDQHQGDPA